MSDVVASECLYNKLIKTSMSTQKYRRRRAMRTPTDGVKYQNEPIQGPIQQTNQGSSFNDLGREDEDASLKQTTRTPATSINQKHRLVDDRWLMQ